MLYLASHGYVRYYTGEYRGRYEHRVVTGAHRGEVVHHRNGKRWDNRPGNLETMTKRPHDEMPSGNGDYLTMTKGDLHGLGRRGVRIGPVTLGRIVIRPEEPPS